VSEETAGADSVPERPGAGVDPVTVALALGGASQAEKARAHFANAAALDLSPSDKSALASMTQSAGDKP
jgi:hypothetical protein